MEDDFLSHYIDQIFKSIWRDGLNMNDQNIIDKVLKFKHKSKDFFFKVKYT